MLDLAANYQRSDLPPVCSPKQEQITQMKTHTMSPAGLYAVIFSVRTCNSSPSALN